jgi:hypothetical protein
MRNIVHVSDIDISFLAAIVIIAFTTANTNILWVLLLSQSKGNGFACHDQSLLTSRSILSLHFAVVTETRCV